MAAQFAVCPVVYGVRFDVVAGFAGAEAVFDDVAVEVVPGDVFVAPVEVVGDDDVFAEVFLCLVDLICVFAKAHFFVCEFDVVVLRADVEFGAGVKITIMDRVGVCFT